MTWHRSGIIALCFLLSLALAGCGGGGSNPAAPTSAQGVTLVGTVVGGVAAASAHAASGGSLTSAAALTVFVQENPAITATVGADGGFTLRGLPQGGFTLVFEQDGATLGTLAFNEVGVNQQITITVMISGGSVVLLEQRRNGIGHGDLEIEGLVEQVQVLDPSGESRFSIGGHTVVARPGETAIRQGSLPRSVSDVTVGRRVHVKGVWLPAEGSLQPVLAHEIKLQGDPGSGADPGPKSFCPDAGRSAEVEGKITAKGASDIEVFQSGKGNFLAQADSGTRIRKGNKTYSFDQLTIGSRVHVKGTSTGLAGATCGVHASEIKLQN